MKIIVGNIEQAGKETQYELGKYLRRRYNELLGPGYSPQKVYIRSSDTDRTLMSALCNAAGLFSPSGDQIWEESISWQPVPIHTIPLNEDHLVYQSIPCPKVQKLYDEYMESQQIKELLQRFSDLREFVETHSGKPIKNVVDFVTIYDALEIEHLRGLP